MLRVRDVELPLPVVWSPPGPFNVEIDDLGMGFDAIALHPELLPASRRASWILRREWSIRGDSRRIRLHGPSGVW
jgi:hypothetical protein